MFKSGAVRIDKCKDESGEVKIHAKEQQTSTTQGLEANHVNAEDVGDKRPRQRHLEYWLGATFEGVKVLLDICDRMLPRLVSDAEIVDGVRVLDRITRAMREKLEPQIERYGESYSYGSKISVNLRDSLFPADDSVKSSYEALVTLQSLHMYLAHLFGLAHALQPAAQALWDHDLCEATGFIENNVKRQQAWVLQQMRTRSPQTLVVPAIDEAEGVSWLGKQKESP